MACCHWLAGTSNSDLRSEAQLLMENMLFTNDPSPGPKSKKS
jgi:hypothetical protein